MSLFCCKSLGLAWQGSVSNLATLSSLFTGILLLLYCLRLGHQKLSVNLPTRSYLIVSHLSPSLFPDRCHLSVTLVSVYQHNLYTFFVNYVFSEEKISTWFFLLFKKN